MAKTAELTEEESIRQNLENWCFEVGTTFEAGAKESARLFLEYIGKEPVVDLGCGDGAAISVFTENGNKVTAVDINPEKLNKVQGAKKVQQDFLTFLTKPVDNIFMHHSLEHFVNYEEVLKRISKHTKGYCLIAVPNNDHVHSVHHVQFETVDDIIPPNMEQVKTLVTPEQFLIIVKAKND